MNATTTHNPSRLPLLLLLLIIAATMLWVAPGLMDVDTASISHAVERHGLSDIERIHKCLDEQGPLQTWFNPTTKRWAQLCKLDESGKSWGIQIVEQIRGRFQEITAFPSWETWLDDVEGYLVNRGYMQIGG